MATTADYLSQLQADKQTLANNLVEKGVEATNEETFTSLVPKVLDIQSGGGDTSIEDSILTRSITNYSNDRITSVGANALHNATKLVSVNLPKVTTMGANACNNCTAMTSFEAPLLQTINTQTFYSCDGMTFFNLPSLKAVAAQSFRASSKLARVDLGVATSIAALSFDSCPLLVTFIVRTPSVCTLANASAFTNTPIAAGTGYIYVSDTLLENYKSASNWSNYASQIKGLSELEG